MLTPTLHVTCSSSSLTALGSATTAMIRRIVAVTASTFFWLESTMTNSSPTWWPRLSLMRLT